MEKFIVNMDFSSVIEAIQALQLMARNNGKEPTHIVLSKEYQLRLSFEVIGMATGEIEIFNGMRIVVVSTPELTLTMGYEV